MAPAWTAADSAGQSPADQRVEERPSYKERAEGLRLTEVADNLCSSDSTCASSEDGASSSVSENEAALSSTAPQRNVSVEAGLCANVVEGVLQDVQEDSDGEAGSPLSKSAKRRFRRRRQRDALRAAVTESKRLEVLATVMSAPPSATASALGLVSGPAKQFYIDAARPSTPFGSEPPAFPCSPQCARPASHIVGTTPNRTASNVPSCASDASTRVPSCASTPAGGRFFGAIPGRPVLLGPSPPPAILAQHPLSPGCAAAASFGVLSVNARMTSLPCSPLGDAASRATRLNSPAPASALRSPFPSAVQACAPQVLPVQPATWGADGKTLGLVGSASAPDAQPGSAAEAATTPAEESDTFRILFGAIGPPPQAELVARLQAAAPDAYED